MPDAARCAGGPPSVTPPNPPASHAAGRRSASPPTFNSNVIKTSRHQTLLPHALYNINLSSTLYNPVLQSMRASLLLRPLLSKPSKALFSPRKTYLSPLFTRSSNCGLLRAMSTNVLKQPVKLACVQLASGADKAANLTHAASQVAAAAATGAKIVVLPECFNSPYGCQFFPDYAEVLQPSPPTAEQAPSFHALSAMAADNKVYLVGGSIPELNPTTKKYYNTSLVFGPDGGLLETHRKVHLFDIDIPGKITFKESDVLTAGNKVTLVDLPDYGKIALAICYDVRFPELATIAARKGAFALIYPGAFNLTTGELHWSLLARGRAVDNQIYVAMCSPARDMSATYHAWGHSMIVDPMAKVLVEAEDKETIVHAELDNANIAEARKNIPLNTQRRFDVYPDISAGDVRYEEKE